MSTVTIEQAQAHLAELIERLGPGEELKITRGEKPIARLTAIPARSSSIRVLGSMKGTVLSMSDDFDSPLEDFREYME